MKYERKSDKEIALLKRKMVKDVLRSREPLLFGVIVILLTFLFGSFLPSRYTGVIPGPSVKIALFSILAGAGVALFTFIIQILSRRKISDESYFGICKTCLSTNHNGKSKCECGGKIEPQEFFNER
jgi:hypothetical protein